MARPFSGDRASRGQASHMLMYVLTLLIFVLVILFGYKMVENFKGKSDDLLMLKFERDLQATLQSVSYGTAKIRTFTIPAGYREFWLADIANAQDLTTVPPTLVLSCQRAPPEIRDALESGTGKNAFLYGAKFHAFTLERVSIRSGCITAPVTNNQLELRLSKG